MIFGKILLAIAINIVNNAMVIMSTAVMTSILLALEKKIPEAEGKGFQLRIHRLINWLLRG